MAAYCQVYGVIHFTSPAGWLPVHWDQLRAQRSVMSMGKLFFLLLSFTAHMPLLMATSTFELGRRCWSSPHQCLVSVPYWQTHKRGSMDQKEQQHQSRWGEWPTEACLGQYTYWRLKPEVSSVKAADCRANHCLFCFRCLIQSNLPKWIPLKWITRLKGCHLSDLICTQCKV